MVFSLQIFQNAAASSGTPTHTNQSRIRKSQMESIETFIAAFKKNPAENRLRSISFGAYIRVLYPEA
jgi:hypothetical protein